MEAFCPACSHPVDAVCPNCRGFVEPHGAEIDPEAERRALVLLRRVLSWIYLQRNGKFAVACAYAAFGFSEADGLSLTAQARRSGVGKAAVSKVCRELVEELGIDPSRYQMKGEAREGFRLTNWRPVKL